MYDNEHRDYIQSHNANQLGALAFNCRMDMFDDGIDDSGIYDENNGYRRQLTFAQFDLHSDMPALKR